MSEDREQRSRDDGVADREGDGPIQVEGQGAAEDRQPAAGSGVTEAAQPAAEVEELRSELESLNDRHLRLAAEFDNYRKRNERDRVSLAARLQLDLVRPLLEVLDDLERVISSAPEGDEEAALVAEGVRLVEKKFRTILEAAGLEELESEGEAFDPSVMEALMTIPTSDPEEDDRVADVFQKGYLFGGTLVRPARVRVLKYEEGGGE